MPRNIDRRTFVKGAGAGGIAGLAGLAGCTGGPEDDGSSGEDGTDSPDDTGTPSGEDGNGSADGSAELNVGMVYATGGLGDGSFNDQAQTGLQQAAEEFDVGYDESQPDEVSQFANYQQQYAQSTDPDYGLVSCIGFLQADALGETSADFPDQDFMIVDEVVENDNVASYTFAEHEGSFLVGQLAGLLTTQEFSAGAGSTDPDSTSVGFVGGVESALIQKFEAGFLAGAAHANADVDIQTTYVGDFNAPGAGQEAALAMYNNGADVVYHAAGNTGTGVFQAAQEAGRFAIGVDQDQSLTRPNYSDVILASMVKRVDTAVYNSIEAKLNGELPTGDLVALGLEQEGVAAVYGDELGSELPEEVTSAVESSREAIIGGELEVPQSPSDVSE
ncbi:BMP family lipoprotein [Halorarum salinum]|uniref:BMP family protein n=1 Tax=Halorarum salinum TaxID=2743089 RepID=A0A7D5QCS6_9EURY|nr:BMP family protein [Halobaculum salinum]QLG61701.1 BMP family protein [Halobaculum salinum]